MCGRGACSTWPDRQQPGTVIGLPGEGVFSFAGMSVHVGVVKASGSVCVRLLRACLDNAAVKLLAATSTLSAPR